MMGSVGVRVNSSNDARNDVAEKPVKSKKIANFMLFLCVLVESKIQTAYATQQVYKPTWWIRNEVSQLQNNENKNISTVEEEK